MREKQLSVKIKRDYYPSIRKQGLTKKFDDDRIDRIKELYNKGFTIKELAPLYSTTETIIREIVDDVYRNQKITRLKKSNRESQIRRKKRNPELVKKTLAGRRKWYAKIKKENPEALKKLREQQRHSRRVINGFYFRRFWESIEKDLLKNFGLR